MQLQQMVVRSSREHELTGEELEQGAPGRPYIDLGIIWCAAKNDFRCSVERRHQDICLSLGDLLWRETRAKVTKLDAAGIFRDHDVVRFEVCMNETVAVKQAKGYEKLTSVENDAIEAQADVATEPIKSLAKVHVHTFVN